MKKIIAVFLMLLFSFQSTTKADDIRDFEIEGMSIGDSLLDYFTKEEISKNTNKETNTKNDHEFSAFFTDFPINLKTYEVYDYLRVEYLTNDKNFTIHGITGMKDYKRENIQECYDLQKKIEKEFDKQFSSFKKRKKSFPSMYDETGKSKITAIYYESKFGYAETSCYHFSNHVNYPSGIDISISSANLREWLINLRRDN